MVLFLPSEIVLLSRNVMSGLCPMATTIVCALNSHSLPGIGTGLLRPSASASPNSFRTHTSPATLFQLFLLYEYRVATMDRRSFGIRGSEGEHYLRISIATGDDDLHEAMNRIAHAAKDHDGFRDFVRSAKRLSL